MTWVWTSSAWCVGQRSLVFLSIRYDVPLQTEQSWFHAKVGRTRPLKDRFTLWSSCE